MSLTASQIFSKIDRVCGTSTTYYSLANKAIDVNLALSDVYVLALKSAGWNVDDFNHEKDPIITIDLVASQRDYHFTYDEQSNLILGIRRVVCMNSASGDYVKLDAVDQQSDEDISEFWDGNETTGVPTRYDKTANGIFLDPVPSYAATNGLKIFIDREPSYFISTDTTKVAGIDGLCHDYLYLKPCYEWARDKGLSNVNILYRDMNDAWERIKIRYGADGRERDTQGRITANVENNR